MTFPWLAVTRTLRRVWMLAGLAGAYAGLVVMVQRSGLVNVTELSPDVVAGIGLVLSAMLIFRANRAHERWWEARSLWGTLVNVSRNLAVKSRTMLADEDAEAAQTARLITTFAWALRDHLRNQPAGERVAALLDGAAPPRHVPSYVASLIYEKLAGWKRRGRIDQMDFRALDVEARALLDVCGGCEKIKNTPVARSYTLFTRHCIIATLLLLPWELVQSDRSWTIAHAVVLAYFVIGLETIAHAIEDPFGTAEDHLDLDGMCRTIEATVNEIASS